MKWLVQSQSTSRIPNNPSLIPGSTSSARSASARESTPATPAGAGSPSSASAPTSPVSFRHLKEALAETGIEVVESYECGDGSSKQKQCNREDGSDSKGSNNEKKESKEQKEEIKGKGETKE